MLLKYQGCHNYVLLCSPEGGHDVPLPGLRACEVEGDDEGQDEAVDGDQQVPGQVDRLGRPVPTHETPATEMKADSLCLDLLDLLSLW